VEVCSSVAGRKHRQVNVGIECAAGTVEELVGGGSVTEAVQSLMGGGQRAAC
jgi:hypothetical protein